MPDRTARKLARTLLATVALAGVALGGRSAVGEQTERVSEAERRRNVARAIRLLDSGEVTSGALAVSAEYGLADGRVRVRLELDRAAEPETVWTVSVVAPSVDEEPYSFHAIVARDPRAADFGWVWTEAAAVPDDFQDLAVVVENSTTGRWGAALAGLTESVAGQPARSAAGATSGAELAGNAATAASDGEEREAATAPAPSPPPAGTPGARQTRPEPARPRPAEAGAEIIRLVPPAQRPAVGRVRLRTVVTTDGVRSAVFYLDGERVAIDERPPFAATLELADTPRPYRIRVEALGYGGVALGADEITVNLDSRPFAVRIRALEPIADSPLVEVTTEVSFPPWQELDRLELYRNQRLEATLREPPFVATIEGASSASDFLRAVAYLTNGEQTEDARLFSEQVGERLEVNLVEVYSIVTDREGRPVSDLTQDRFRLRLGRREMPIERFGLAEEVPLVVGLIIDSSESMDYLMDQTKRAAARFLSRTILDDDRAFLVDFDTQPRLAHGLSGDLGELVPALGRLRVGGNTAIYDAIIYSLTQFEREPGRRALVLLTDGRDFGSKFGIKRCLAEARRLGVPVYVIAISDAHARLPGAWMRKKPKKAPPVDAFLEGFSHDSGGRLFSIADPAELGAVYETINAELRSQFFLAFSTRKPLTERERASLELDVTGAGLSVRSVVLNR